MSGILETLKFLGSSWLEVAVAVDKRLETQAAEIARLRAAINDALTAPFPDPELNSTWHQEPIGPNETPEEAIKRLVSVRAEWEVHKNNCENPVIAELRAELTRLRVAFKWHIERDGDDLLICEGDHDRHEGCIMQRWVKAENVATARRDAMEEATKWHDEQAAQAQKFSDMKVSALDARVWGDNAANHREYAAAIRAALERGKDG